MMKITMKGGVWKNSEDEILKAAVMKYGLNNWSRVASLLVRKSAKQCKARWHEWLSPFVKKTDWSRNEEEKLLHLAKLFPNQWKTIAPVVGRTAHQCLERYDQLLDQAQGFTADDSLNDPRKLKPGEIDPYPETKPSRADAIDMEDDEKEMLAEARARLANTRGKKAKRKAREKQLEEARRLAVLQKRRELKVAGLGIGKWRQKDEALDFSSDIPFEQQPPKGFYNVGAEETPSSVKGFGNILLQQVEGLKRQDEEKRLRRDDMRKLKRIMDENLPKSMQMIEKLNDFHMIRKKTKLELPSPRLTDKDLQELVNLNKQPMSDFDIYAPTTHLLKDQQETSLIGTTLRTPLRTDIISLAARDAFARTVSTTPLEGGKNPELHNVDFKSQNTSTNTPCTPSLMSVSKVGDTPFTYSETPLSCSKTIEDKSNFKINQNDLKCALLDIPNPSNEVEIQSAMSNSFGVLERFENEDEYIDLTNYKSVMLIVNQYPRPSNINNAYKKELSDSLNRYDYFHGLICNDNLEISYKLLNKLVDNWTYIKLYELIKDIYPSEFMKAAVALVISQKEVLTSKSSSILNRKLRFIGKSIQATYINPDSNMFEFSNQKILKKDLVSLKSHTSKLRKKLRKLDKKFVTLNKGYFLKIQETTNRISISNTQLNVLKIDFKIYNYLYHQEINHLTYRLSSSQENLKSLKRQHNILQNRYADLLSKINTIKNLAYNRNLEESRSG